MRMELMSLITEAQNVLVYVYVMATSTMYEQNWINFLIAFLDAAPRFPADSPAETYNIKNQRTISCWFNIIQCHLRHAVKDMKKE